MANGALTRDSNAQSPPHQITKRLRPLRDQVQDVLQETLLHVWSSLRRDTPTTTTT